MTKLKALGLSLMLATTCFAAHADNDSLYTGLTQLIDDKDADLACETWAAGLEQDADPRIAVYLALMYLNPNTCVYSVEEAQEALTRAENKHGDLRPFIYAQYNANSSNPHMLYLTGMYLRHVLQENPAQQPPAKAIATEAASAIGHLMGSFAKRINGSLNQTLEKKRTAAQGSETYEAVQEVKARYETDHQPLHNLTVEDAIALIYRAAKAGNPLAMADYGLYKMQSSRSTSDDKIAHEFCLAANQKGHRGAQACLYRQYREGRGTVQNIKAACAMKSLYNNAADCDENHDYMAKNYSAYRDAIAAKHHPEAYRGTHNIEW